MTSEYERMRDAIAYLAEHADRQPSLAEVAAHVGVSPAHLQRRFSQWAGVSPKRFVQHLTAARAKALLAASEPVLDTAFAVGLSSSGRLHDLIVASDAVTPGEYRAAGAGVTLRHGVVDSPFGPALVAGTDRGVCALRFMDDPADPAPLSELTCEWPAATLVRDDAAVAPVAAAIFGDTRADAPMRLHLRGTNFQLKVWEALLRVPEGALISYGDLARRLDMPTAARAVASAVGANPIGYLIPCHRVLRSSGALGGYRWGLERKMVMLEVEEFGPSLPGCP